jgi:hypothetical protein
LAVAVAAVVGGCPGSQSTQRNPFLTATENFGVSILGDETDGGGAAGGRAEGDFRSTLTLTLVNNDAEGELNTAWMAWVYASSIRSAEQQDTLLSNGYVQLTRSVSVGTAFTLSPGTFVYNGPGTGGATLVRIDRAEPGEGDNDPPIPAEMSFGDIVTPDVMLIFSQPPVSCDTPAFFFTLDGQPLDIAPDRAQMGAEFGGATTDGAVKTLAQVDAYQCSPLQPGLFFKSGGGARQENEFFEGQDLRIDFFRIAFTADDFAAFVRIGDNSGSLPGVAPEEEEDAEEEPAEEEEEEEPAEDEGQGGPP